MRENREIVAVKAKGTGVTRGKEIGVAREWKSQQAKVRLVATAQRDTHNRKSN